jgi:nitroreductase
MLRQAAAAIAVCGDPAISDLWVHDCSAATENILVAAVGLGLGGVWLSSHGRPEREQAIREVLGIPQEIDVLSLVSLGHPAEQKEARTQFDPARVHHNRW